MKEQIIMMYCKMNIYIYIKKKKVRYIIKLQTFFMVENKLGSIMRVSLLTGQFGSWMQV